MCLNDPPPSAVRTLANALSLNLLANPALPNTSQNDTERTPEEIKIFHNAYLSILPSLGMRITHQDQEEMRLRGLPPIPEENLAWARGVIAWPPVEPDEDEVRWLLDEDRRFEEPEEYTDNAGLIADDGSDSPPERIPITPRGASPQPLGIPNEYIPIEEDETYGSDPGLTADDTRSLSPSSRRLAAIELDAPNPLSDEWNPEMEDEQIALQDVESTPSLTWSSSADESGPATPEQVLELGDAVRIVGGEEGRSVGVSGFEGEDREGVSGFEAEGWEGEVEGD